MRRLQKSAFLILLAASSGLPQVWAEARANLPSADAIVARMSKARAENRAQRRPLVVARSYKLFGKEREASESEVTAHVSYVPPGGQSFSVHKDSGSELGEMIVRRILDHEKTLLSQQDASDISTKNYAFRLLGEESRNERPCYVLQLTPLRKDSRLLLGKVWIDEGNDLIVRIEGEPAQPPSWWVRNIHLTLDFSVVHGMWVQSALTSTANVRMLGPHTIVAHDVNYKMGDLEAAAR